MKIQSQVKCQRWARLLVGAICLVSTGRLAHAQPPLPPELAAGFKAGFTCSAVFHAGRTLEQIKQDELGGVPQLLELPEPVVDRETRSITCAYASKPPRLAVFLSGLGTVLLPPGATLADAQSLPKVDMPLSEGDPAQIPWPDGDLLPEAPPPAEIDVERLNQAVAEAFGGARYQPSKTLGIVVVYKDRIVAERYADGWNMHTPYRTWSTAKSLTNALIGVLVRQGKLRVEQPAPIPEWQG
ncbi:MAG: serine hydrolase, partial [Candidatus Hydrogenedentes bacterium]|nr:serine hydrolase [Candidatus Hydrogenedentota bacterium]